MAGVPVKFRCYRCNQLLGVSRTKVGSTVSCPKCATELIVPDPDEASATVSSPSGSSSNVSEPTPAFLSALASGVPLAIPDLHPEDIRVEPGIAWDPFATPPASAEPVPAPPEPEPEHEFAPEPAPPVPGPPEPALPLPIVPPAEPPRAAVEPVVPPIVIEPPKTLATERAPTVRSRDLVIPRSVVAFWSLFVLLAQALGFVAGLLAGHFLWRIH